MNANTALNYTDGMFEPTTEKIASMRAMLDQLEQEVRDAARDAGDPATAAVTEAPVPTSRRRNKRKDNGMTGTGNATTQPHQGVPLGPTGNAPTFAALLQDATRLGEEAGKGKDTLIKFDMKLIEAAYLGTIDLTRDKHGDGRNDATVLSEAYVKAQQGAIVFDAKAANQRKTISNAHKMIKLGSTPKWGQGEPLANVNTLLSMRQNLRKSPQSSRIEDAHNMLMRYATTQLKQDTLITGAELKSFCFKRDAEQVTAEDVLEAIRKKARQLWNGKVSNCPDVDTSAEVRDIINAVTKRLAAIAKAKGGTTTTQPAAQAAA